MGKTTAVWYALTGRPGVLYISLRDLKEYNTLTKTIAEATGVQSRPGQLTDLSRTVILFKKALAAVRRQIRKRVIIVIDDIHTPFVDEKSTNPCISSFMASLLELYLHGDASVIYLISEYDKLHLLQQVSGHSSRLDATLFPAIQEEELIENLSQFAKDYLLAEIETKMHHPPHPFLLDKSEDAITIVKALGATMDDILRCIRSILVTKSSVEDAIQQVITLYQRRLRMVLEASDIDPKDRSLYFVVLHTLLNYLQSGNQKANYRDILRQQYPFLSPSLENFDTIIRIRNIVNWLVDQDILAYVDVDNVCLHSAVLKLAYSDDYRVDPTLLEESEADLQLRND